MSESLVIGGQAVPRRSRCMIELELPPLYTQKPLTMPVQVVRGGRDGPRLFITAAIHGDELNGTEIIRRLLKLKVLKRLRGSLIAVPIVNIYGLLHLSRYLPDRRDLNRSFPGSDTGSMAARLANLLMTEIVSNATHGIDLHTGAIHRSNLPQIRADLDDAETRRLAESFGVPVLLNANVRDGSLRGAAAEHGIPMLLYEAGEALRYDEVAIRAGVRGIIGVMRALEMLPPSRSVRRSAEPYVARTSSWVRAQRSGLFRRVANMGSMVKQGDTIGLIDDPYGGGEHPVLAARSGIVIGCSKLPLVYEGEALFHVARFSDVEEVAEHVEEFQIEYQARPDAHTEQGGEPPIA